MPLSQVVTFLYDTDNKIIAKDVLDAFSKYATTLEQYDELGRLYEKTKHYPESIGMLEKCLARTANPTALFAIRSNLAKVYNHLNDPQKSLFYSNINFELNPSSLETQMEISFSNYLSGNLKKSYDIQTGILSNPLVDDKIKRQIRFNMGSYKIGFGQFKEGMRDMIVGGKEIGIWKHVPRPFPMWDGKDTDKTILVYSEAGIGDEILNIRFMNTMKRRGLTAIWVGSRKDTNELFKSNGFNVISSTDQLDPTQNYVYTESMSLPVILEVEESELWVGPYLTPKQEYIDKWKSILPEEFVTIRWAGNPFYDHDLHRSIDFEELFNVTLNMNLPIVSLQIDDNKISRPGLIEVDITSWEDTLAIQHLSKLNITSCTSTAHSASAIGAKCIVLPPICTYYPWMNLKENFTSWWYGDTTKAFVQTKHKDWSGPLSMLLEEIKRDFKWPQDLQKTA